MRKFTIIELLIVISILAVIIAMLLPALQKAREKGLSISCIANLKQIGIENTSYVSDFNGTMPPHAWEASPFWGYNFYTWQWFLWNHASNAADNSWEAWYVQDSTHGKAKAPFDCPGNRAGWQWDYAMNMFASSRNGVTFKVFKIKRPSSRMIYTEFVTNIRKVAQPSEITPLVMVHSGMQNNALMLDSHVETKKFSGIPQNDTLYFWGSRIESQY